jgi:hypothetical protein
MNGEAVPKGLKGYLRTGALLHAKKAPQRARQQGERVAAKLKRKGPAS